MTKNINSFLISPVVLRRASMIQIGVKHRLGPHVQPEPQKLAAQAHRSGPDTEHLRSWRMYYGVTARFYGW